MNKNMVVYVDFDRTLFDTPAFSTDLRHVVANSAGLSYDQVVADAARFRPHERLHGYDYAAHVSSYGLDLEVMWQRLDEVAQSRDYLYPDAAPFIRDLRADGFDPKILSFGERRFQEAKIKPTLPRLVGALGARALEYAIVYEPKNGHIATLHPGERGVLIDDIDDQDLPDGFTEIHLDRSRTNASHLLTSSGYAVANLAQAADAVSELYAAA